MKKIFLLAVISIAVTLCIGQGLPKGSLIGLHPVTITLKPGITESQFKDFFVNKILPEYEKSWTGLKGYLVKSVRGPFKGKFAIIWLFESEKARDKYFNPDGTANDLEKQAYEKVKPIEEELKKYGTYIIKYLDDWIVQ